MRSSLDLIAYTVLVPIWIVALAVEGLSFLAVGDSLLPDSRFHVLYELLASNIGERPASVAVGLFHLSVALATVFWIRQSLKRRGNDA